MVTAHQATFPGFQFPNTTQIPNEVFDSLMPHLSGGELKVLLYICRRTFGFRKDSDSISLTQIAHGITTKAGRVLDQGTGLSKRHVINALKALEKRNIITVTRKVDETGLNEVNTYSLNMLAMGAGVGTKSPQGVVKPTSPGVVNPSSPGVVNASAPTKQREQNKEEQKKDIVDDAVAKDLENFGITKSAATTLMQTYPLQYIREKLKIAKELVAAGSCLVSQNPAGWLRRAIEEDYCPPRPAEKHQQRHSRKKKDAKPVYPEPREQHLAEEESQQVQNVPTEPGERDTEKKEPEKTSRENETTWNKTLENLQADLPSEEVVAWLTGTTLIEVTETAARIGVANRFAIAWLERRLYREISNALKGALGKDLDLQVCHRPMMLCLCFRRSRTPAACDLVVRGARPCWVWAA
jgi:phage replication O-like protein O